MQTKAINILSFVFVLLWGCEQPFTPKGPYVQKLAVVGILSNTSDTQYVRVFKTYNPPGFDPYEVLQDQAIRGASVVVTQGASAIRYQETAIPRPDTSRFNDMIVAYAASQFRLEPGKTYNLDVTTPSDGGASAPLTVPDTGWLRVLNPWVLSSTGSGEDEDLLAVQAWISPVSLGYIVRFYLDYEVLQNSNWVPMRMELPSWEIKVDTTRYYGYPKLVRRSSTPGPKGTLQSEGAYFMPWIYQEKVGEISATYGNKARLGRLFFVLTQVEQNLYTFYNLANGYQDAFSIRLDMPDWTNISGGLGVFGAMVEDTLYVDIPN